jgi:cytidylate kinase
VPVVTLSRQFGAAGGAIGRSLAERFGAEFLDREVVALVAERMGIPEQEAEGYDERLPGLWQRLMSALAASSPELAVPPLPQDAAQSPQMHERMARLTRAVIEEAADRGNAVIVGRGAGFILRDRPGVLRVQLHASLEDRVRYLAAQVEETPPDTRPDEDSLRELCRSVDAARDRYLRDHFDVDWNDARHYDLALDTGRLGLARSVDLIESAARQLADRGSASPP